MAKGSLARMSLSDDTKLKHKRFAPVYFSALFGALTAMLLFIFCWVAGLKSSQMGSVAGLCWVGSVFLLPMFAVLQAQIVTPFILAFGVSCTLAFAASIIHAGFTEYE
mmetsp:Transcript_30598/g.75089  ORF Transcript_30598/g.75089 Transcript_30598/m.75089 type:complete len:108 (+) Transcript_30598:476-799(+)|eukprot:CAMPEP_0206218892 /NCGR_PEP_ID=MMETSP0047_2-20121206/4034_1 /ASSEMBLY_ACC=CAM_ASM_000192 /TAXON_ID=195065 /ORGANISM="Chroomonas mesostigmatica_cf, Strain CCMP1168" /LENGTH=107 /DNA_ID=CAMNT_0053641411 /DNA_START=385 /DNA_END=708 /DNA_ORIENTATION=+